MNQKCLRKQWRTLNKLRNHFWRKWINEYLPELTRRSKNFERVDPLKCDDIVIVCDEDVASANWLKGMVVEAREVKMVKRGAVIMVNGKLIRCPVSKLDKLDIGNPASIMKKAGARMGLGYSAETLSQ